MPGHPGPVTRLFKATRYDSNQPLRVLVGADLTEPAGFIAGFTAFGPDRTELGRVRARSGWRRRPWEAEQPGLPVLTARPIGASALRYRFPFSLVLGSGDSFLPFRFRFQPPGPGPRTRSTSPPTLSSDKRSAP